MSIGSRAWNAARLRAVENNNNRTTQALLTRIDTPESEAFAREVVRVLRNRENARFANARLSGAAARGAGTEMPNLPRRNPGYGAPRT
jgi:hypothetical protein